MLKILKINNKCLLLRVHYITKLKKMRYDHEIIKHKNRQKNLLLFKI